MDVYQIRKINFRRLLASSGGHKAFSDRTGIDMPVVSRINKKQRIGKKLSEQIEQGFGLPAGALSSIGFAVDQNCQLDSLLLAASPDKIRLISTLLAPEVPSESCRHIHLLITSLKADALQEPGTDPIA